MVADQIADVLLDRDSELGSDDPGEPAILTVRSVSKSFGGVTAVRDISLDVPRGAIVSIIGPNGAGKTTTGLG